MTIWTTGAGPVGAANRSQATPTTASVTHSLARRADSLCLNVMPISRCLAPNPLGADHDVVEVALLGRGRPRVPVVLEEERVDGVRAVGPDPVESGLARVQVTVDPEFEHTIGRPGVVERSEEHTSELQSPCNLVCRLLLEKKKTRT